MCHHHRWRLLCHHKSVLSDVTFYVSRTTSSERQCHRPQHSSVSSLSTSHENPKKIHQVFFAGCPCLTVIVKMTFDSYPVNCLVRWIVDRIGKVGRDVVTRLIISDNQSFHSLIINPLDNQTVTLPWLSRISDTSETSLKGLILIIKSTYQPWYLPLLGC